VVKRLLEFESFRGSNLLKLLKKKRKKIRRFNNLSPNPQENQKPLKAYAARARF